LDFQSQISGISFFLLSLIQSWILGSWGIPLTWYGIRELALYFQIDFTHCSILPRSCLCHISFLQVLPRLRMTWECQLGRLSWSLYEKQRFKSLLFHGRWSALLSQCTLTNCGCLLRDSYRPSSTPNPQCLEAQNTNLSPQLLHFAIKMLKISQMIYICSKLCNMPFLSFLVNICIFLNYSFLISKSLQLSKHFELVFINPLQIKQIHFL
jgi:hypothetical protein